ncbi:hypothetical protein ACT8ZV_11905 [Nocardioides sp. MAHUQ-72]|uniref:hypothetical protein n=1 Tax=unclassified Nocardioides TaxID=2615069 RepID=UPI00362249B0
MRARRLTRDEHGAAALLFALLATVLFGIGAFAVDIGHAYAKRSLEQTDVDVAVMAAAAELDSSGGCNPEVVAKATEYLTKADNAVPSQYPIDLGGAPGDQDGYISCKNWRVDLWAPASRVDFALAGALPGAPSGVDVDAHAAAQIKAARAQATLPFFAVQGCDFGQQSIRNDSGPQLTIPPLNPDSAQNSNASFTISPDNTPSATTSLTITITGTQLKDVTQVGFTGAAGPPYHYTVPVTAPSTNATASFTVAVPSAVLAVDDTWYVRTLSGTKWSKQANAQRLTVGPPKLYCDNSNEGNFGTIDIPRTDTNSFSLQWNMIKGVEPTLAKVSGKTGQCSGEPGAVESKNSPVNGTNCLATEPGLKIAETNEGMITGKGGLKGRLDADSTSGCSRTHDSSRTTATIKGFRINDDVLTCFITNGASIQNLVNGDSVATQALSSDIYNSPRFFWVPVLDTDPSTGKKSWWIKDFRPGFITDQSMGATHDGPGTISPLNGLVADSQGITELKVVLFDEKALPEFAPTVGGEQDYTGSGPKALVLVE